MYKSMYWSKGPSPGLPMVLYIAASVKGHVPGPPYGSIHRSLGSKCSSPGLPMVLYIAVSGQRARPRASLWFYTSQSRVKGHVPGPPYGSIHRSLGSKCTSPGLPMVLYIAASGQSARPRASLWFYTSQPRVKGHVPGPPYGSIHRSLGLKCCSSNAATYISKPLKARGCMELYTLWYVCTCMCVCMYVCFDMVRLSTLTPFGLYLSVAVV